MKIVLLCRDKITNHRVFILYNIMIFNGKRLKLLAGKPYKLSIEL